LTGVFSYALPFPVFLAGALVTFRGAAALVFFTTVFILYTSFPRSVTYGFRVYAGEVTAVSRETALDSQTLLAPGGKDHDEVTENLATVVLALVRHEEVVFSLSCGRL